ncbi:MAG: hypothetical protein Q4A16_07690 [Lautropia sp.]|nr:hypothetical protein [Lautropia sp.]
MRWSSPMPWCVVSNGFRVIVIAYADGTIRPCIEYLGPENGPNALQYLMADGAFAAVVDNVRCRVVFEQLVTQITVIDVSALFSVHVVVEEGVFCTPCSVVNACIPVGKGVIVDTGCIIERGSVVGNFAYLAPGAMLSDRVRVDDGAFIGLRAALLCPGVYMSVECAHRGRPGGRAGCGCRRRRPVRRVVVLQPGHVDIVADIPATIPGRTGAEACLSFWSSAFVVVGFPVVPVCRTGSAQIFDSI